MKFWDYILTMFTYGSKVKKEKISFSNKEFTLSEYQDLAFTTALYPERGTGSLGAVNYVALGMGSEVGEIQGKLKKVYRDNNSKMTQEIKDKLIDEMSDVLWYLGAMSTEFGVSLNDVAKRNLDKLFARKEKGTIKGSGDDR